MSEKLERLSREIEKTEAKLRRAQHEEKILEHQIKQLTRKERTHQICNQLPFLTGDATLPLRWLRQLPFCGLAAQKQRALQVDKKTVIKRTL